MSDLLKTPFVKKAGNIPIADTVDYDGMLWIEDAAGKRLAEWWNPDYKDEAVIDALVERLNAPALRDLPVEAEPVAYIDVVFDGPPSHESGRFVEVENEQGRSINFGEWVHRPDGYWALRFSHPPKSDRLMAAGEELQKDVERYRWLRDQLDAEEKEDCLFTLLGACWPDELDAAIDAAIKEMKS